MGRCSGMGLSLSNILSDQIEAIANSRVNPIEVISTSDMLYRVNKHNEDIDKEIDPDVQTCLIAGDVVGLFPALLAAESGKIVREATIKIMNSGLKVEGLDTRLMATYVRMNMSDFEIRTRKLQHIVVNSTG